MNSAMTTERKANPTFANLSSVTKVETDHPYLLWSHRPKLAKASSIGADSEKIKTKKIILILFFNKRDEFIIPNFIRHDANVSLKHFSFFNQISFWSS